MAHCKGTSTRPVAISWQGFLSSMGFIIITIAGCGVLRMYDPVRVHPDDWVTYGGNAQRTNIASYEVRPPLVQVWEYDAGAGFGNSSVAVADSLIFVGTLQGELHVIRIKNGKRVGSVDLGSAIVGTPIVWEEFVYVPLTRNEENLVAFNLFRGVPEWRAKVGDVETSPLLIENKLFVTTMQGELVCIDRVDGAVVWTFAIPSHGQRKPIRSSPAADDRAIYFGADDGRFYAVQRVDGKLLWAFATRGSIIYTPSVQNNRIYFGSTDNTLYCLSAASGALIWKRDVGSKLYGCQAADKEHVIAAATDGRIYCFDALSGEVRWTFRAKSVINSAPLVSGSVVYVGSLDKHLYALDGMTGQLLWSQAFSSRIKSSPVVWHDFLVVLLEDRTIVVFRSREEKPS